jgi:hypothetical protein
MKLTFSSTELEYLHDKMCFLMDQVNRPELSPELARVISKMKYKFTPNASLVYLTQKERAFLLELLTYRQNSLIKVNAISEEADLIQALMEKLDRIETL